MNLQYCKLDINSIINNRSLEYYQYMCERNAIRMVLIGAGIEEPLLLMRCAIYIYDNNFYKNGTFSTFFNREMFNPNILPILGEKRYELDWDYIDHSIRSGIPVLINADVYELPYKANTYYHRAHAAHSLALIDIYDDKYIVLDWYHPDYFYGALTRTVLEKARTSSNQSENLSAFSGQPINSTYRCVYIDNIPRDIDIKECVIVNMMASVKSLLTEQNSGILFLDKISMEPPKWLARQQQQMDNLIKSLFLLYLEIHMVSLYIQALEKYNIFQNNNLLKIKDIIMVLLMSVNKLKNHLILSIKKKQTISNDQWYNLIHDIKINLTNYCVCIINMLK